MWKWLHQCSCENAVVTLFVWLPSFFCLFLFFSFSLDISKLRLMAPSLLFVCFLLGGGGGGGGDILCIFSLLTMYTVSATLSHHLESEMMKLTVSAIISRCVLVHCHLSVLRSLQKDSGKTLTSQPNVLKETYK